MKKEPTYECTNCGAILEPGQYRLYESVPTEADARGLYQAIKCSGCEMIGDAAADFNKIE